MRRVIVESPLDGSAAEVAVHIAYACAAVSDCLRRGEAPMASHLLHAQPGILSDADPDERRLGMEAGLAWGEVADCTVAYTDLGVSEEMAEGIKRAILAGRPVLWRRLNGWSAPLPNSDELPAPPKKASATKEPSSPQVGRPSVLPGASTAQEAVLDLIGRQPGSTVSQIAEATGVNRRTVTNTVGTLRRAGRLIVDESRGRLKWAYRLADKSEEPSEPPSAPEGDTFDGRVLATLVEFGEAQTSKQIAEALGVNGAQVSKALWRMADCGLVAKGDRQGNAYLYKATGHAPAPRQQTAREAIKEVLQGAPEGGLTALDVSRRLPGVPAKTVAGALQHMVDGGDLASSGTRKLRRYRMTTAPTPKKAWPETPAALPATPAPPKVIEVVDHGISIKLLSHSGDRRRCGYEVIEPKAVAARLGGARLPSKDAALFEARKGA